MKLYMCSVRDRQLDAFGVPVFVQARGVAVRSFNDEINRADPSNPLYKHPEDYELFEIGIFDDETAQVESHEPRSLAVGTAVVVK